MDKDTIEPIDEVSSSDHANVSPTVEQDSSIEQLSTRIIRKTSLCFNSVLVITAFVLFGLILTAYFYPPWLDLVHCLNQLMRVHLSLILLMMMCVLSTVLGGVGIYAVMRNSPLILGIQLFATIFLVILEVVILYTVLTQWLTNLEVGVTFAVQLFRPGKPGEMTMSGIQYALGCCGRGSLTDYYISNEDVPINYVPFSCCDLNKYSHELCRNSSFVATKGKIRKPLDPFVLSTVHQLVIPKDLAYSKGCAVQLHDILLPIVISVFVCLLVFTITTTTVNGIYLQTSSVEEEIEDDDY
ncbi:unnamed protein product [Calicophoron daubneyi]|uniref:Tetraspanin n=1 Tax=Calicophoron daubneyi TaxID=300641 RepID=A0AAV2U0B2_CALDB